MVIHTSGEHVEDLSHTKHMYMLQSTPNTQTSTCHPKDPTPQSQKSVVVYQVSCESFFWGTCWTGWLNSTLKRCLKEHKKASGNRQISIVKHAANHFHGWTSASVVDGHLHFYHRCFVDVWHIWSKKNPIFRQDEELLQSKNAYVHSLPLRCSSDSPYPLFLFLTFCIYMLSSFL